MLSRVTLFGVICITSKLLPKENVTSTNDLKLYSNVKGSLANYVDKIEAYHIGDRLFCHASQLYLLSRFFIRKLIFHSTTTASFNNHRTYPNLKKTVKYPEVKLDRHSLCNSLESQLLTIHLEAMGYYQILAYSLGNI